MKIKLIAATAALLACTTPGFAFPVNMDFEGATSFEFIKDFYNGGTDSSGASGTNYRVSFGADLAALANDDLGPYFSNQPGPGGTIMTPVGSFGSIFAAPGLSFLNSVSFFYTATQAFTINAFSSSNANVGTLNLAATNDSCVDIAFCSWSQATLNLTGAARSIDFSGGAFIAGFDNIKTEVPAPAPALLMASGLFMLSRVRLRRKHVL